MSYPQMSITLDPPYRLRTEDTTFNFVGWAQVRDQATPNIRFQVNGVDAPIVRKGRPPRLEQFFPDIDAESFYARVDFAEVLKSATAAELAEPFLLRATVTSEGYARTFEYQVTEDWIAAVLGRRIKPAIIPPEHLQIRVAGAAAGGYHATGMQTAKQIAGILAARGHSLQRQKTILDFGCGPGRVMASMRQIHPRADLYGSDIDPEAIAWAAETLSDLGEFHVNGHEPPLPFADETFDLIYGISVFTHLPEDLQWAWLTELGRVVKPGGLVLTTKLNPAAYDLPAHIKTEGVANGFVYWGDAAATEGLPGFYRLAYHTNAYIHREWSRYFEVLHVGSHDLNDTQDAILLRRKAATFGERIKHVFGG